MFFLGAAEVIPGQVRIRWELFLSGGVEVQACLFKRVLPQIIIKTFLPQVESCSGFECGFDDGRQASVAPAYGGFEDAAVDIVKFEP